MDIHTESYKKFRTGLSFAEIFEMLKIEQREGKRCHVTRHTILGKWREIKIRMYEAYYGQDY